MQNEEKRSGKNDQKVEKEDWNQTEVENRKKAVQRINRTRKLERLSENGVCKKRTRSLEVYKQREE